MNLAGKKRLYLALLMILSGIFATTFLIKMPYRIKAVCRLVPTEQWTLQELPSGRIVSRHIQFYPYQVKELNVLQFDREDFVRLQLSPDLVPGKLISRGTLIGEIVSADQQIRLSELEGRLAQARAELQALQSGSKPELQEKAEQELNYARTAAERFQPELKRTRELYNKQLISYAELERAETQARLLQLNVAVAESKLRAVNAGEKQDIVRAQEAEIDAVDRQLQALRAKLNQGFITAPINGIIVDSYMDGDLCHVVRSDTVYAQVPISLSMLPFVENDQMVKIHIAGVPGKRQGRIVSIGNQAQIIQGMSHIMVVALFINKDGLLRSNMTGTVTIYGKPMTFASRLKYAWLRHRVKYPF